MAIDFDAIALALRTVITAATGIPLERVYWSEQDHPEGVRPFATLSAEVPLTVTQPEQRIVKQVQQHTIQVDSTVDGLYRITVDGEAHDFVAASSTATQIRDELVLAVIAGSSATASAAPDGPAGELRLFVEALTAGVVLAVSTTANLSQITIAPFSYPTKDAIQVQAFANEELEVTVQISTRYDEATPTLNASAMSLAENLRKAVFLPSSHEVLSAAHCPVLRVGAALDLSALTGAQWDQRAAVDLTLSVPSLVGEEPGTMATVETSGTYA